ncbi:MAG TPA: pilus assembly protein, partial [Ramlibacter sp.]|nr:pilus assembly protein [Ramlibacter sp.]
SGGRELFLILVAVDVILGPLITLAIFDRRKSIRELRLDLSVVALLQLAALGYGMWTVAVARPVHLVFEIDRFRVVHAVDVPLELMDRAEPGVSAFPWNGPTPLAVRPFRSDTERADATIAALRGVALGARPDLWQPYTAARERVLKVAQPAAQLKSRLGVRAGEIDTVLRSAGRSLDNTAYVPMVGRKAFWTAFIDPATADVVAFMPLDSF